MTAKKAPRRDVPDDELRALVHIVGPVESEPDDSPVGYAWTQRCLRCEEVLAVWRTKEPPARSFAVGGLIAADPYTGIAGGRETVERVGPHDRQCEPLPAALL